MFNKFFESGRANRLKSVFNFSTTIKKIIDKKKDGRRTLYLIKWEGFDEKDATWEPLSNLGNVKELVKDFERTIG